MLNYNTVSTAGNPASPEQQSQALEQYLESKGFLGRYDESVIAAIEADRGVFQRDTLPNIDDAILDDVVDYLAGSENNHVTNCLDRFNGNWRSILENAPEESQANLLITMLFKLRTYNKAIE